MVFIFVVINVDIINIMILVFMVKEEGDNVVIFLSLLVFGLFFEVGILVVVFGNFLVLLLIKF